MRENMINYDCTLDDSRMQFYEK